MSFEEKDYLEKLLTLYADGSATDQQIEELSVFLQREESSSRVQEALEEMISASPAEDLYLPSRIDFLANAIVRNNASVSSVPVRGMRFLRAGWMRYAAAILLFAGIGGYFYFNGKPTHNDVAVTPVTTAATPDIAPGTNKATLTLSNGQQIELKEGAEVLNDAGVPIKKSSGELVYGKTDIVAFNTMTTPRGGQYKLALPDGSKVWLNAASSITYPTAFTGNERNVKITGEVYFEIAKDKNRPFRVKVNDAETVVVLGTQFNVNAYPDEPSVATTLVEGSVRVSNHTLKPGEASRNGRVSKVDVSEVVAWKEGKFSFQDADINTVMRQLSRWYDVEVEFRGKPNARFFAIVKRSLNLSDLLKALEVSGNVKFTIAQGKIIVH